MIAMKEVCERFHAQEIMFVEGCRYQLCEVPEKSNTVNTLTTVISRSVFGSCICIKRMFEQRFNNGCIHTSLK